MSTKKPVDLSFPHSNEAKRYLSPYEIKGSKFKDFLKLKGYDSVIVDDIDNGAKEKFVVVFDSNQIKSVKTAVNLIAQVQISTPTLPKR